MDATSHFPVIFAIPLALGIVLRAAVLLHPYSGMASPPMFGDYEAQRHWMEITVNLPVSKWYVNTSSNDLQFWGLDYPPLTAYHSYVLGRIAKALNPQWVELFSSRGFESAEHKRFMRMTVLVSDLLTFFIPVLSYCAITLRLFKKEAKLSNLSVAVLILSFPGLILIDHGHFQYNCVSLGLFVISLTLYADNFDVLGSMAFCLSLLYKQMELYHALPIFFYLLSKSLSLSFLICAKRVLVLAATVCLTFAVFLFPFLTSLEQLKHVAMRMFPIDRGLFEDKVANFWCISSVFIKWSHHFSANTLFFCCILMTIATALPACVNLFRKPTFSRLVLTEAVVSSAFFLFSYQVHEKSILLVCVPVLCLLVIYPLSSVYFLIVATLSMWQLFVKDELYHACLALVIIFYTLASFCLATDATGRSRVSLIRFWPLSFSIIGYAVIFALPLFVQPPARYPFLFSLCSNAWSFAHFIAFFIFWYWRLLSSLSV